MCFRIERETKSWVRKQRNLKIFHSKKNWFLKRWKPQKAIKSKEQKQKCFVNVLPLLCGWDSNEPRLTNFVLQKFMQFSVWHYGNLIFFLSTSYDSKKHFSWYWTVSVMKLFIRLWFQIVTFHSCFFYCHLTPLGTVDNDMLNFKRSPVYLDTRRLLTVTDGIRNGVKFRSAWILMIKL